MVRRFTFVWVFFGVILATLQDETRGAPVEKRSAATERITDDYPDYNGVRYDEYPVSVTRCLHVRFFLKRKVWKLWLFTLY